MTFEIILSQIGLYTRSSNAKEGFVMNTFIRILFMATFVITAASLCVAQSSPPPPPPPAKDYSPQVWQEFSTPEGRFKIKLPGEPQKIVRERDTGGAKQLLYTFNYGTTSFIIYTLSYTDYPQTIEEAQTVKKFLDGYREGRLAALVTANYRVINESEFLLEGHPTRLLQVEVEKSKMLRMKTVVVGPRLYSLIVLTSIDPPMAMGAEKGYEKIAMAFLDSFQLIASADKK